MTAPCLRKERLSLRTKNDFYAGCAVLIPLPLAALRCSRVVPWLAITTATLLAALATGCSDAPGPLDLSGPTAGWPSYGGDPGGARYSTLTQITRDNVSEL